MAKRKAWQRALGGIGEGIGNASQLMLRQQMQDRYDSKIAGRQREAADRQFLEEIGGLVAENKLTPEQGAARLAGRGINVSASSLRTVRPSLTKRLAPLGDEIAKADKPEVVPTDDRLASRGADEGAYLQPDQFLVPDALTDVDDPFAAVSAPELVSLRDQATTRRRALRERPSEKVTAFNPDTLSEETRFVSPYTSGAIQSGPTPQQQGRKTGLAKVEDINTSGQASADQAGREARATGQANQDITNDPLNVKRQVGRASSLARAESNARFPNDLRIAQERAKIEVAQAINKENAINLIESTRASQQLRGFFDKLQALSAKVNTLEGIPGRAVGLMRAGQAMIGDDPDVRQMQQLIAQNLRPLAVLMGVREANVSESETRQALEGIGIKAWTTSTEAANALRNLQEVIDFAPLVAAQANTSAPIGERMAMVSTMSQQRRQAEQRAIQLRQDVYIDPILNTPRKVIK